MTLADLIEAQQDAILAGWVERVRPLAPRPDLSPVQLVGALPAFLAELVRDLRRLEDAPLHAELSASGPVSEVHGGRRQALGYTTSAVAREYHLLQEVILQVALRTGAPVRASETLLLTRLMGVAVSGALSRFLTVHERQLMAEDKLTRVQEAEARARESEARLRLVLDAIPSLITFVDRRERYVLTNRAYRTWFGIEPESLLGRPVREAVGEENYGHIKPFLERAFSGQETHYEQPFVFQGGRRGYARGHYLPYVTPGGEVLGLVGFVQDVTEDKRRQVEREELLERARAAQAAAEVEHARLYNVFENAPAIVATLRGPQHVFEMVNPLFQRALGAGRALVGKPVAQALPEVVGQGFIRLLDGVYRTGEPFVGREALLRVDRRGEGQLEDTYVTFVYQPQRDVQGHVVGIDVFGFEVTEQVEARKRLEALAAQLRASEERLRRVVEASATGTWELDVASGSLTADARQRALMRVPQDTPLTLKTALATIHAEDREAAARGIAAALAGENGGRWVAELRMVGRRPRRWVETRGQALLDAQGKAVRFVGTSVDITARKKAERAREALLEALSRQPLLHVSYLRGPRLVFELANPLYRQLFGGRELIGKPFLEALPELRGLGFDERMRAVLDTGEPFIGMEMPARVGRGDGTTEERIFNLVYQPVPGPSGAFEGVLAIGEDVTELVRGRQRDRERAAFEQQLVGIVSHDLRNPLQSILLGTAGLLRRDELDERSTKALTRIQSAAERAVRLIRDLLDFTQARLGGSIPVERRPADLHEVVGGVLEEVEAAYPGREVEGVRSGDGRGAWDADRLAQVVQNLVTNALKYSPEGTRVRVETRGEDGWVTLSVHNRGTPIPPGALERLFEPFQRGTGDAVDRAGRSVGLGLFIVKQLVAAHGGTLAVRSGAEEGTTFTVRLPRAG